ncbi:hypothetical protein JCM11251_003851 [Rhodosporidiobolus azoricus]
MPLDSNLFVLLVRPRAAEPGCIDFLVDRTAEGGMADEVAYTAYKDASTGVISLLDPLTLSPLGLHSLLPPSVPNSSPNPRHRLIQLDSPQVDVPLKSRSGLSWCWEFEWESARYEWERDVGNPFSELRGFTLLASRKPDPNYPVASYSPKKKGGSIEMYDYNLSRVEPSIQDKKGLEITTLLALSFFIDPLFNLPSPNPSSSSPSPLPSSTPSPSLTRKVPPPIPSVPPGADTGTRGGGRLTGMKKLDVNEVEVVDASPAAIEAYSQRCLSLLEDPTLLYLLIFSSSSSSPTLVPAVASLAERVKRERYKKTGEELLLFVDDDGADGAEGVREGTGEGEGRGRGGRQSFPAPPPSLRVYLSRIELSELLPNHRRKTKPPPSAPPKPPIRPPIVLDSPAGRIGGGGNSGEKDSTASSASGSASASGGGWRALLGGSRGSGSSGGTASR